MRYYSTQRPFGPGTFPRQDGTETITNFDGPTYCEEISREAWGYIDYQRPLAPGEAERWELTPAGLKMFWCVTSSFDDRGRVVAAITRTIEAAEKPENSFTSTPRKDIYNDWFDSREAALEHMEEAKRA